MTDGGGVREREAAADGAAPGARAARRGRGLVVPALVFAALAAAVALTGWVIFARQAADMRAESAAVVQAVHKAQSRRLSVWFTDEVHDTRLLAGAPSLVEPLARSMAPGRVSAGLRAELALYRLGHDLTAVTIVDGGLRTVVRSSGADTAGHAGGASVREKAAAAEALRRGDVVFSGAYVEPGGKVAMDFAAPLRGLGSSGAAGGGAVVVHIDAEDAVFPLLETWPVTLETGESVIVTARGGLPVLVNPLPGSGPDALEVLRPAAGGDLPAALAVSGRTGIVEGADHDGEPVLAAIGKVPGTPWYLVAQQDLAAVDQSIVRRGWTTLAWAVACILLAAVVLLLYWRRREARDLRDLVELERDRSRAEAQYAALMREAEEIVVVHRPDGTIVEANDWALRAYGYSREELVGKTTDVFMAPGQPAPAEQTPPVRETKGRRTFESVHRRRDGVEFPVEVGLSTIEIDGEELVLEVIRDVGERKAAEIALRESEARYRTLFENALSGFALEEVVLDEQGEPVDFVTITVNPAFETQTGLRAEDVVGRRATQAVPGIVETGIIERGGRVALTGRPERAGMYFPALGRYLDIQFASPRRGQFAAILLDVTDRHEAEEMLASFFAGSQMGLFILDRELCYVRVNETLAQMNRCAVEDHAGRPVREVLGAIADHIVPALERVVGSGEAEHDLELRLSVPEWGDGERRALVSMFPIKGPDGEVRLIGGAVLDVTAARRAEREVRESREFLERVLGVTPDVIYIFDFDEQRNVFSNRGMDDLLGHSPEELRTMGPEMLARLLHPDDAPLMAAHHRRARELQDGEVLEVEYRMRHADGAWRILRGRDTVFRRDDEGRVTQLVGTAHDVTRQRAAEAELLQITQRLEATVMASPLAIVIAGPDRTVRLWNPAAAAVFGWSAAEVVGRELPIIPPDMLSQTEALQRRLAAGEQFAGLDLACVRKDGERIHTSMSLALMHETEGEPDSALMIFEDVTERRANVVRLARLTRLYQVLSAVTEAIPEGRDPDRLFDKVCRIVVEQGGFRSAWVGRKRRNGLVHVVAAAGAEGTGLSDGEQARAVADRLGNVGVALAEGRSDTTRDVAEDLHAAAVAAEAAALGIRSAAAVPIFIDGRHDTVLAIHSSEPGRFDAEELALLERLAADVGFAVQAGGEEAARRKAERRLEALNRNLERRVSERTDALAAANAELEAFSYSVSHDLRAPLRALEGFSLALLEDYEDQLDEKAADYLTRIRAASQRMARLIDDLLTLSRVARRDMTAAEVDLTALARAIGAELAADEPGRQVSYTVEENMSATGDAQLLDVALRNLLGNAWKFTSRTPGAEVAVGVEQRDGESVYFVRDNGAGFDARYADKLFTPFQRLHDDGEFPGTGIGLATVRRIVGRHRGRVWAEGATGRGATVWFTLGPRGEGA